MQQNPQTNAPYIIPELKKLTRRVSNANKVRAATKNDFFAFCSHFFRTDIYRRPYHMRKLVPRMDDFGMPVRDKGRQVYEWAVCDSGWFHVNICDHINDDTVFIMIFRESAKTTYLMRFAPIWEWLCDPLDLGPLEELQVTAPQNMASNIEWIDNELHTNEKLGYTWEADKIYDNSCKCRLDDKPEIVSKKKHRIFSRSYKSGVRGSNKLQRPYRARIDDIIDRKEAKNPDLRKEINDFIYQDVWRAVTGPKLIAGTPMDPDDFISTQYNSPTWKFKMKVPAEFYAIDKSGNKIRVSNWPDYLPIERLDKMREEMERECPGSYAQEMLLDPIKSLNSLFTPEMLPRWTLLPSHNDSLFVISADLAYGYQHSDSKTAIVTWGGCRRDIPGVARAGDLFMHKCDNGHFDSDEAEQRYVNHWLYAKRNAKCVVEKKAWSNAFVSGVKRICNENGIRPPVITEVDPEGNDKRDRMQSVTYFFHRGRAFLDPTDQEVWDEFRKFTGHKKQTGIDIPDASFYALNHFAKMETPTSSWFENQRFRNRPPEDEEPYIDWDAERGARAIDIRENEELSVMRCGTL